MAEAGGVGSVWGVSKTRSMSAGAAPPSPVPACTPGFASLGTPLLLEGPLGSCLAWPPPPPLPVSFRPPRTSTGAGPWPGGWPPGPGRDASYWPKARAPAAFSLCAHGAAWVLGTSSQLP